MSSFIIKRCCINMDIMQMNTVTILDLQNANLLQNYGVLLNLKECN